MTIWDDLAAPFPEEAISWRAQSLTKAGDKAMALAYIDARDVMRRLDEVVGPANWQDRYEVHGDKTICYLSICTDAHDIDGVMTKDWITKADGAGDTAVEAEKGSLSDSFKRAAVKWGIGRYLYDMSAPWVPCETYESNGKKHWKAWTGNPWDFVRRQPSTPPKPSARPVETPETNAPYKPTPFNLHFTAITQSKTVDDLTEAWRAVRADTSLSKEEGIDLTAAKEAQRAKIATPTFDGMPQ
jgi:hypothetical protein